MPPADTHTPVPSTVAKAAEPSPDAAGSSTPDSALASAPRGARRRVRNVVRAARPERAEVATAPARRPQFQKPTPAVSTEESDEAAGIVALTAPSEGIPAVIDTDRRLTEAAARFAAATGPVAVDAERASGFSYGQEAYLVQLRREGAGTILIDPIACPDLSVLNEAIKSAEWIFHAASQDLACLAEVGLVPSQIFDTELAARLLGLPRVGLGAVLAQLLQVRLAKEHSAVNWSKRPLHRDWLNYAALDVELLVPLRDALDEMLVAAGKREWARQEFEAIRLAPPAEPRVEPWRRTSGLTSIKSRQGLAIVRELWQQRDHIARNRNIAVNRILSDQAILAATNAKPKLMSELLAIGPFAAASQRRYAPQWLAAVQRGLACPETELPTIAPPRAALGRNWRSRDPEALERLALLREGVAARAEELAMPTENLISPEYLRRFSTDSPDVFTHEHAAQKLVEFGARPWQVEQVADIVSVALCAHRDGVRSERDAQPTAGAAG